MQRLGWLLAGALPVLLFVWNVLYYTPWMVDDAFISLRYARNLGDGNGLVYNPGETIEGFSNFSWVLLAAALMRLDLPVVTVLKVVGLLGGVATLLLAAALAYRLSGAGSRLCATMTLWYLGCNTSLALWCQSGLETSLFSALIVAMFLRYEIEIQSARKRPLSAVFFALAWMTRPEAPVFALYFLVRRAMIHRRLDRTDLGWLGTLAAIVIPYEIWGYLYYGSLFPQTHAAKIGAWSWSHFAHLKRYLFDQGWGFTGLVVLGVVGLANRRRSLPPVLWAPLLSGLFFVVYAGGDWMPRYRLFVPIIAIQGCFVSLGVHELLRWSRRRRVFSGVTIAVVLLAGAGYAGEQLTGAYPFGSGSRFPRAARTWSWWLKVPENLGTRNWPPGIEGVDCTWTYGSRRPDRVARHRIFGISEHESGLGPGGVDHAHRRRIPPQIRHPRSPRPFRRGIYRYRRGNPHLHFTVGRAERDQTGTAYRNPPEPGGPVWPHRSRNAGRPPAESV